MHRAVAARVADGNLSLFEALQLGGFEYSMDDDANALDSEGVTLGQRKNQLSRRLRQARKHPHPGMEEFTKSENERKRRANEALLDEELEECRKGAKQTPEAEHAFFAKNHSDFGHSVIAQATATTKNGTNSAEQKQRNGYKTRSHDGDNGYRSNNNGIPSQVHVHQQVPISSASEEIPSGVALATFKSISQSLGMSMEQLALALSSSENLLQVLTSDEKQKRKKQQELACNLYTNELQALIQRCMLLAGYTIEQALEGTPCNLDFSYMAWQQEGRRLKSIYNQKYINEPPIQMILDEVAATRQGDKPKNAHSHSHHQHGNHHDNHDDCATLGDGRHVHQLEGKCGHKAILHQPLNGAAHIDFVVGNKVECYANVQPLGNAAQNISVWPSQYSCQELPGKSTCSQSVIHDQLQSDDCGSTVNTPRILDLDDVDFSGQEWNSEVANDETLLGLFKLSDSRSFTRSTSAHSLCASSTGSGLGPHT